jgi:hypothetical protein
VVLLLQLLPLPLRLPRLTGLSLMLLQAYVVL